MRLNGPFERSAFFYLRHARAVTIGAGRWRWLVEQHIDSIDLLLKRVALRAGDVFMST